VEEAIPKKAYHLWLKRYVRFGLQRVAGGRLIEKPIGNMRTDELQKLLGHIMLRRSKEQVLDLPEKVVEYITVDIPARWRKEAQDIFEKLKKDGYKLRFSPHIQHVLQEYGLAKVKPAVGIITDSVQDRGPVVVWAVHHSVIDALVYELQKKGLSVVKADGRDSDKVKEKAVEDFQQGRYDVFVAGLTAMNTGYTLTRSNTAIFVQTTFTPSDMRQAEDRIYRIGQTTDVLVWYLVGDNGEEHVLRSWRRKEMGQKEILDKG
jgi:SWI/SNF-related matrix-associated actin-dependent regulator 1 of chromatin subfamily A